MDKIYEAAQQNSRVTKYTASHVAGL